MYATKYMFNRRCPNQKFCVLIISKHLSGISSISPRSMSKPRSTKLPASGARICLVISMSSTF